jgi:hypothetical protein
VFFRPAEALDAIDAERLKHGGVFAGDLAKGTVPPGQAGAARRAGDGRRCPLSSSVVSR